MKQPRVPEFREKDGTARYIKTLVLFLKDFCFEVWRRIQILEGKADNPDGKEE